MNEDVACTGPIPIGSGLYLSSTEESSGISSKDIQSDKYHAETVNKNGVRVMKIVNDCDSINTGIILIILDKRSVYSCNKLNEELSHVNFDLIYDYAEIKLPACSLSGRKTAKEIGKKCEEFYNALISDEEETNSYCLVGDKAYQIYGESDVVDPSYGEYTLESINNYIIGNDKLNDEIENSSISQKLSIMILLLSLLLL